MRYSVWRLGVDSSICNKKQTKARVIYVPEKEGDLKARPSLRSIQF
jgi:hypothetical protein